MKFKYNYKYKNDDKILAISPLILTFYINKNNWIYLSNVMVSSYLFWTRKNIITDLYDRTCATITLIRYNYLGIKKYGFKFIPLPIGSFFFYIKSCENSKNNERQIVNHLLFRTLGLFTLYLIDEPNSFTKYLFNMKIY